MTQDYRPIRQSDQLLTDSVTGNIIGMRTQQGGTVTFGASASSWSSLTAPTISNSVTATVDTSQTLLGHFDTSATSGQALFSIGEDVASTKTGTSAARSRGLSISTLSGSTQNPFYVKAQGGNTFFVQFDSALFYAGLQDSVTTTGGKGATFNGGDSASANAAGSMSFSGGNNTSNGAGGDIVLTSGTSVSGQYGLIKSNGFESNNSKTVTATNSLTAVTLTTRYTYLTGTAGASMAVTFPAGVAAIDGEFRTIFSVASRASATYVSTGASFVGAPTTLAANTAYKFQYDSGTTSWYLTA